MTGERQRQGRPWSAAGENELFLQKTKGIPAKNMNS